MRSIVVMSLGLALALPGAAGAQSGLAGGPDGSSGRAKVGASAQSSDGRDTLLKASTPPADGAAASRQKLPRPENAIGPDLIAYVFAPIGGMVVPISAGLRTIDAVIAPVTSVFQPLTGPYVTGPETAPVIPEPVLSRSGPRK